MAWLFFASLVLNIVINVSRILKVISSQNKYLVKNSLVSVYFDFCVFRNFEPGNSCFSMSYIASIECNSSWSRINKCDYKFGWFSSTNGIKCQEYLQSIEVRISAWLKTHYSGHTLTFVSFKNLRKWIDLSLIILTWSVRFRYLS